MQTTTCIVMRPRVAFSENDQQSVNALHSRHLECAELIYQRFETAAHGVLMDLAFALSRIGRAEYTVLIAAFDPQTAALAELALQKAFVPRLNTTRDRFFEIARELLRDGLDALREEDDACRDSGLRDCRPHDADRLDSVAGRRGVAAELRQYGAADHRAPGVGGDRGALLLRADGGLRHSPRVLRQPDAGIGDDPDVADLSL
jgi:hypothetical protein